MSTNDNLKSIVSQINGKRNSFPAMKLIESNPEQAAIISKLIRDDTTSSAKTGLHKHQELLNAAQMRTISDNIRARVKDNENILSIFPDIEMAIQILISSILSPKDMVKTELIYKLKESLFPASVTAGLLDIIRQDFDGYYGLKDDLQYILRDVISRSGAHVKMVLPESIVDAMINEDTPVALENLQDVFDGKNVDKIRHIGFLGEGIPSSTATPSKVNALESFFSDKPVNGVEGRINVQFDGKNEYIPGIEVVDNYNFLKMPKLMEVGNKQKRRNMLKQQRVGVVTAMESLGGKNPEKKLTSDQLASALYKNSDKRPANLMVLPSSYNTKRRSVGRCYYTKLPPESVMVVHQPGNPEKHLAYFILTDNEGNPLSDAGGMRDIDGIAGLMNNQGTNQNMNSLLIERAKNNLVAGNSAPTLDNIAEVCSSIVESDLIERWMRGVNGQRVEISGNQEVYRIMMARSLKGKSTRLVFVPAEFISYFALKYYPNGTGKAYLDEVKNLTSIRAILLFSKVMAHVKSSINVTKASIQFDPNDPDPQKTIEILQHETANVRQMYFPLGINSPYDLTDWIQRAGFEWSFENHPGLPQTKINFESDNFKHEIPDQELDEILRKQTYMALGVPPEKIDQGFDADFATSIMHNNLLLAKRITNVQDVFILLLTQNGQRILYNDQELRNNLLEFMKSKKGEITQKLSDEDKELFSSNETAFYDEMLDRLINLLSIELPRPDVASLDTQKEAFATYKEACEEAIEYWVGEKVASEGINGELANNMDKYKDIYMSILMRRWMVDNNYLSEMADIIGTDDEGDALVDVLDEQVAHIEGIARSFLGYTVKMRGLKTATDKDLNQMDATGDEGTSSSSTSSGDSSSGGGNDGNDGFGGDFDLDAGLGGGNDNADPAPEGTPEVEEEQKPDGM